MADGTEGKMKPETPQDIVDVEYLPESINGVVEPETFRPESSDNRIRNPDDSSLDGKPPTNHFPEEGAGDGNPIEDN